MELSADLRVPESTWDAAAPKPRPLPLALLLPLPLLLLGGKSEKLSLPPFAPVVDVRP